MQTLWTGESGKTIDAQRVLAALTLSRVTPVTELLPFLLKRVYSGFIRTGYGMASVCCVPRRF
jgi:type III secretory pathway component EscT